MITGKFHFLYSSDGETTSNSNHQAQVTYAQALNENGEQESNTELPKKKNFFQRIREALREWSAGEEE